MHEQLNAVMNVVGVVNVYLGIGYIISKLWVCYTNGMSM